MNTKNTILILFSHPSPDTSEVNISLFKSAQDIEGITCIDLYADYPKYNINVQKEQQRLLEHHIIIFLFPLYWYSTPALLKDWMDLVLEYGFAYGKDGNALRNKYFLPVISAGAIESAYQNDGFNHFPLRDILRPIEQMAVFCQMKFIAPFVLFSARTAREENRLIFHLQQWKKLLTAMLAHQFDFEKAQAVELLAHHLDELIVK